MFTTIEEAAARAVTEDLGRRGHVPTSLFAWLEYVAWSGAYKALEFVPGVSVDEVVLVDVDAGWVRPDQRGRWVAITPWDGGPDGELVRVRSVLGGLVADVGLRDA